MTGRRLWIFFTPLAFALVLLVMHFLYDPYRAEMERTVRAIGEDSDLVLIVFTDLHFDPARKEPETLTDTMACAKALTERCSVDALWNLGDLINGHREKSLALDQLDTVIRAERKVTANYHNIQGNHDNNFQATLNGFSEAEVISNPELNAVLANNSTEQTEHHSLLRPTDYYVDFPGIRVICLTAENTEWTEKTAQWLADEALQTTRQVLVLSHIPTRPEWGFRNDVTNGELIEDALQAFTASGGTLIAFIHGHDHGDQINNVRVNSPADSVEHEAAAWQEVAVGCARFQKPASNGTEGMTFWDRDEYDETKVLFDVVCISQERREVRFVRFGAGEDRTISY